MYNYSLNRMGVAHSCCMLISSQRGEILCYLVDHYNNVTMSAMEFQIISLTIVYSGVYSGTDQRKHLSSASLAFVRGIHLWPMNSPHKGLVTRKMFDDVIMHWHRYRATRAFRGIADSHGILERNISHFSFRTLPTNGLELSGARTFTGIVIAKVVSRIYTGPACWSGVEMKLI